MKKGIVVMALFLIAGWGTAGNAGAETASSTGRAEIMDVQGKPVGTATLKEDDKGVSLAVAVSGLPPGKHGIHVHAVGKCEPPEFKTAAGHFNPHGRKHGLKNPEGSHAGDLPNLEVGPDGSGQFTTTLTGTSLKARAPGSLRDGAGTSIVIHAGPDDETTDPAGNSGARIACGVIR